MPEENNIENSAFENNTFDLWTFPFIDNDNMVEVDIGEDNQRDLSEEIAGKIKSQEDLDSLAEKEILQNKIAFYDHLNGLLDQKIHQIDRDLLITMINCIKNITKKVIGHTIQHDSDVMKGMLAETLEKIKKHQSCHILLSQEDYECLKDTAFEKTEPLRLTYEMDPCLSQGDFKLITPVTEMIAIIEDRLSAFFKLPT